MLTKLWAKIKSFLRGWWYTRTQTDPEVVAKALGRPDTLELTEDQAQIVQDLFCGCHGESASGIPIDGPKYEPAEVAREFYACYPRSHFRYFMAPDPMGRTLEYTKVDYNWEGIELIWAAMRKLGAIVQKEDGEYFENAHPLVQRFAEVASKQTIPERKSGGILG